MSSEVQAFFNFVPDGASTETVTHLDELYARFSDRRAVSVKDVRAADQQFNLDINGFEFFKHRLPDMPTATDEAIKTFLYPDTIEFLTKAIGASRVEIFQHIHRTAHSDNQSETTGERGPSYVVHLDNSTDGSYKILRDHFPPEEVDKLIHGRWAVINIWRPLAPVEKDPLGLCDAQTVTTDDLQEVYVDLLDEAASRDKIKPVPAQWSVIFGKYSDQQKWYYMSDMNTEDLVCFKIFDTKDDNQVWCIHSAFQDPTSKEDAPPRQSVEFRCFAFFDED